MATQIDQIAYYAEQLAKVISSHGADSNYTTHAFFSLQGAKMGMSEGELNKWAHEETERLHTITLERL